MLDVRTGALFLVALLLLAAIIAVFAGKSASQDAASAWDARLAKPGKTGLASAKGIYLGLAAQNRTALHYDGDRHIMTLGPNGSGKSMRLLYENLIRLPGGAQPGSWSIVVVDPKGDLARLTLDKRRKAGSRVIVLDPFGASGFASDGCNPLRALDPEAADFPDDAMAFAEAMIRIEGNDPHWPASAQDLVAACIMAERLGEGLSQDQGGTPGSLIGVRRILGMGTDSFRETMRAMVQLGETLDCPELAVKAARYADINNESRELISIVSNAMTQTRWLDSRQIKPDLDSAARHDFAELKTVPTTIYLVLPPHKLATHSRWLRLIITAILQPLLKDTAPAKIPVLLMLDEYPALAEGDGFPIIARNMAMFRGYGIKLWSVWQDLSQAERIYGRHWESFAANAGVLQAFQPQDVKTAAYLSERSGLTARELTNWSWGGRSPSLSGSQQGMPLLLPQAVRALGVGETVVLSHLADGPLRVFLPFPDLSQSGGNADARGQPTPRDRDQSKRLGWCL